MKVNDKVLIVNPYGDGSEIEAIITKISSSGIVYTNDCYNRVARFKLDVNMYFEIGNRYARYLSF